MTTGNLNLRHLHALCAVARHGGISAAAREVNLTQPAITQGLARLETQFGVRLFERKSAGMTPTAATEAILPRIGAALGLVGTVRVTGPQMRAFSAFARHGSYSAAAAALGIRRPSLHRIMSDLAITLGQPLTERRGRSVALTERGRTVARRFRLAEAELRAMLDELAPYRSVETGRITIGAMPLARARLLPDVIADYVQRHPQVDVAVVEGLFSELVGLLRDGDIDLLVGALGDLRSAEDLTQRPLFSDRPVILARANHPLLRNDQPLGIADLARFEWVLPPVGTPLRDEWTELFTSRGINPPRVGVECGAVILVRQLLVRTDFLTLLSPDQVAVELEAGWLRSLGSPPGELRRMVGLIHRSGWQPTALQAAFLDELRNRADDLRQQQQK